VSRILFYTSPAKGHLIPAMSTARELVRRGHSAHVRTLAGELEGVRKSGVEASAIDPRIEARELDDWAAKTTMGALKRSMKTFGDRAYHEVDDLRAAIDGFAPDVLVVDTNTWGAQAAAEASGVPWAVFQPYFTPLPAPGVPPFGPGLAVMGGRVGRARDRALGKVTIGSLTRLMLPSVNAVRAALGLPHVESLEQALTRAPRVLYHTVPELEYPRPEWPDSYRFVGPGSNDESPPWNAEVDRPVVLVTCSTERQSDRDLVDAALECLPPAGYFVVATTGAHDPADFDAPEGHAVVERSIPHSAVLRRAEVTICHGGMGITQRSLASGVPVVVVPFGRDQLEVARRVEYASVGVRLPSRHLKPPSLVDAVRKAADLTDNARLMADHMAEYGGGQAGADVVESLRLDAAPGAPPQS